MELNNEQRKHLAVTLRTIGIGALIPVGLQIYSSIVSIQGVLLWGFFAVWAEILALKTLKGIRNND